MGGSPFVGSSKGRHSGGRPGFVNNRTMSLCAASLPKRLTRMDHGLSAKWTPWLWSQWECRSVSSKTCSPFDVVKLIFCVFCRLNECSGIIGESVGPLERIGAERLRLQVAHGRVGEAQPGHSRIDGVWKPIHTHNRLNRLHHGNASSRLGAVAHLHQPEHQQSWKTRFWRAILKVSKSNKFGYRQETSIWFIGSMIEQIIIWTISYVVSTLFLEYLSCSQTNSLQ